MLRPMVLLLLLVGCATAIGPPRPGPVVTTDVFVLRDGVRLPYRAWMPERQPSAVVLALHGMNDSRDAWEYPAPDLAAKGIAVFAPDQRGFGATAARGYWPGSQQLVDDAREMAAILRVRYPAVKLILMGESMGAAVLMALATGPPLLPGLAPAQSMPEQSTVDGYVLIAPAVWGRAQMNFLLSGALWTAATMIPGARLTGGGLVKVTATDNREALVRLSTHPLTIHGTRIDAVRGLVDLMDEALAAAPRFDAPALFLYGGKDQLIPKQATAATWRALPEAATLAYYDNGYHLLLRDLGRSTPIGDIAAWIENPEASLPSGADRAAWVWLEQQAR